MSIQFKLNSSAQPIAQQSQSSHVAQIHPHATETSSFSKMKEKKKSPTFQDSPRSLRVYPVHFRRRWCRRSLGKLYDSIVDR